MAPPSAPAACGNVAFVLVNNNDRRDYHSTFWTEEAPLNAVDPVGCTSTYSADAKYDVYWTMPLGTEIMLVARGANGVLLGKAVYPVLNTYQQSTLKALLTSSGTTTFTGAKDAAKSTGPGLRGNGLTTGSHGGGAGSSSSAIGDMFLDFDNALIADAQSGFNSAETKIRLTTTFSAGTGSFSSNGHWFGGIGGRHMQGGWGIEYEAQPSSPYCGVWNRYGSNPGQYIGISGNNEPYGDCSESETTHQVDYAIYVDAAGAVDAIS